MVSKPMVVARSRPRVATCPRAMAMPLQAWATAPAPMARITGIMVLVEDRPV